MAAAPDLPDESEQQHAPRPGPRTAAGPAGGPRDKLDMICRKLELKPGERLLDIGCGWGGLARHAAQHYGVDVFGITV
jgi:2-polyprenyl-3-methyl-5-hydroxy-6-metoxy-1,4-benzoquinol methylase